MNTAFDFYYAEMKARGYAVEPEKLAEMDDTTRLAREFYNQSILDGVQLEPRERLKVAGEMAVKWEAKVAEFAENLKTSLGVKCAGLGLSLKDALKIAATLFAPGRNVANLSAGGKRLVSKIDSNTGGASSEKHLVYKTPQQIEAQRAKIQSRVLQPVPGGHRGGSGFTIKDTSELPVRKPWPQPAAKAPEAEPAVAKAEPEVANAETTTTQEQLPTEADVKAHAAKQAAKAVAREKEIAALPVEEQAKVREGRAREQAMNAHSMHPGEGMLQGTRRFVSQHPLTVGLGALGVGALAGNMLSSKDN